MIKDVFAIDVAGAGGEGCAFVSACVTLFEAVELDFCADGVHEAHACCREGRDSCLCRLMVVAAKLWKGGSGLSRLVRYGGGYSRLGEKLVLE